MDLEVLCQVPGLKTKYKCSNHLGNHKGFRNFLPGTRANKLIDILLYHYETVIMY